MPDLRRTIEILIRGRNEVGAAAAASTASLNTIGRGLGPLTAALGVGALSAVGLGAAFRSLTNDLENFGKIARQLGTTTDEAQRLSYVAGQLETDLETLAHATTNLQRRLEEQNVAKALKEIGVSAREVETLRPSELLARMAEGFGGLASQSDKARVAFDLFGRQGREILAVLAEGPEALRKIADATPLFSEEDIKRAGRFNDAVTTMGLKARVAAVNIADYLIATVGNLTTALRDGHEAIKTWGNSVNRWVMGDEAYNELQKRIQEIQERKEWGAGKFHYGVVRPTQDNGGTEDASSGESGGAKDAGPLPWASIRGRPMSLQRALIESAGGGRFGKMPPLVEGLPVDEFEKVAEVSDDIVDKWRALREEIQLTRDMGAQFGATMVSAAFGFGDAIAEALARSMVMHENFQKMAKQAWKELTTYILAQLYKIYLRQLAIAILNTIFGGGAKQITQAAGLMELSGGSAGGSQTVMGAHMPLNRSVLAPESGGSNITLVVNPPLSGPQRVYQFAYAMNAMAPQ